MAVRLLATSERRAVPWKNGGGVTREIAAWPQGATLDAFDWRISMAEVEAAGPFSRFDGVDRILTVLSGELDLRLGDAPVVTLTPGSQPFAFAGDRDCHGAPRGRGVTDLNVMVRRGVVRAEVRRVAGADPLAVRGEALLVLALEPGMIGGVGLARYDGLIADGAETLAPRGSVPLLAIDLYRL